MKLADEIVTKALELGYTKCGIVKINMMKDYAKELDKRVKLYPEVEPIYRRFYSFSNPENRLPMGQVHSRMCEVVWAVPPPRWPEGKGSKVLPS